MSYADLAVFHFLDTMVNVLEMKESGFDDKVHGVILEKMGKFPLLAETHKMVRSHPRVAAYLKARPIYPF